jgi:hypothetical protein
MRAMPMTDARLDRAAAAWHAEFARWSIVRNDKRRRFQVERRDGGFCSTVWHTVRYSDTAKIDAEAWLSTYRDRAAARAALGAAAAAKKKRRISSWALSTDATKLIATLRKAVRKKARR